MWLHGVRTLCVRGCSFARVCCPCVRNVSLTCHCDEVVDHLSGLTERLTITYQLLDLMGQRLRSRVRVSRCGRCRCCTVLSHLRWVSVRSLPVHVCHATSVHVACPGEMMNESSKHSSLRALRVDERHFRPYLISRVSCTCVQAASLACPSSAQFLPSRTLLGAPSALASVRDAGTAPPGDALPCHCEDGV